jgi:hypothetical protein
VPQAAQAGQSGTVVLGPMDQSFALPPQPDPIEALLGSAPLIEEPVTGGGDSTLWTDGKPKKDEEGGK